MEEWADVEHIPAIMQKVLQSRPRRVSVPSSTWADKPLCINRFRKAIIPPLLLGGQQVMASLYLDLLTKLDELGSVAAAWANNSWFTSRAAKRTHFQEVCASREISGLTYSARVGLLEHCVRQCTLEPVTWHLGTNKKAAKRG